MHLEGLRKLNVSKNLIAVVPALDNLGYLNNLFIRNNPIVDGRKLQTAQSDQLDIDVDMAAIQKAMNAPVSFTDNGVKEAFVKATGAKRVTVADAMALTSLDLSGLQLNDRAIQCLRYCTGLTHLNLDQNQIVSLEPISGLIHLQTLSAQGNRIGSADGLVALHRLTSLDLSQNQLRDISGLRDVSALERLDLSQNQITDVSPLAGCAQLAALDLTDNPIQSAAPLMGLPVFDPAAPLGAPFTP